MLMNLLVCYMKNDVELTLVQHIYVLLKIGCDLSMLASVSISIPIHVNISSLACLTVAYS